MTALPRTRTDTFGDDERINIRFVLALASALHRYGTPANRLEEAMIVVCRRLDLVAEIFATPTTLIFSFGDAATLRTRMLRVDSGELDLRKLADLDKLAGEVIAQHTTADEGIIRIAEILLQPPTYGYVLSTVAAIVTSGAMAVFFGGGIADVIAASVVGLLLGLLGLVMRRSSTQARVYELVGAALASVVSTLIATRFVINPTVVTLAALIVLLPGMTLTIAITELATRNLMAGTARLMSAVIVLLTLVVGVALGQRIAHGFVVLEPGATSALPSFAPWIALGVASIAIVVVVQAHPRAMGWIVAACGAGFGGTKLGALWFGAGGDPVGAQLGVLVGAFALGVLANVYARALDRPAQVVLVPATFLLVPGSMGMRGMTSLLDRQTLTGVDTMFAMFLTATAIVAGMLIANAVLSPQRVL